MGVVLLKSGKFRTECDKCYRWSSEQWGWNAALDLAVRNGWTSLVVRNRRKTGGHWTYCESCSNKMKLSDL